MKILVTGANGFVGRAIVEELFANNFDVYELVSLKSDSERLDGFGKIYKGDISSFESLNRLTEIGQIDAIIHSAGLAHQFGGQIRDNFWKTNVVGTGNIAALGVLLKARQFILISSVAVYGGKSSALDEKREIFEETECSPRGFYAQSKLEAEKVARRVCEHSGVALTILRLSTVIGENDKGNVARLVKAIDNKRFVWIGDGENHKSLIYKGDAAKACVKILREKAIKSGIGGTEVFNVTAGALKMSEIVSAIAAELKRKIPGFSISPKLLDKVFYINSKFLGISKVNSLARTIDTWLSDENFSGEKFSEIYGFRAETSISEAIAREVRSYKNA